VVLPVTPARGAGLASRPALVVLAGGQGSRLGGIAKAALLRPAGGTLLSRLIEVLAPASSEALLVAPPGMQARLEAPPFLERLEDRGLGPAVALLMVAEASRADWLLAVGGDHPLPSASLVARLDAAAARTPEAAAVGVASAGRLAIEPLFALYRRAALLACREAAPRSFGALLALLAPVVALPRDGLDPEELDALLDVDTPEDAARHGLGAPIPPGALA
jgi:molybdopterin-guanine dinucleotide biosynthesis protein A